jgi:hypothetical protein
MKKNNVITWIMGTLVGLLAVAPPLPFEIPVLVNSDIWLYAVFAATFFGMIALFQKIPTGIKILLPYVLINCFFSQAPYVSFNAYIVVVVSCFCFLLFRTSDTDKLINFVIAAFLVQVLVGIMQRFGMDTLMNINRRTPVFVGSVMQYMRFGSLLAVMTPILAIKNKWFVVPVLLAAALSRSSSFALGVLAGSTVYMFLGYKKLRKWIIFTGIIGVIGFCIWDKASIEIALTDGRVPVWCDIVKTWIYDTSTCVIPVSRNYIDCLVDWQTVFLGHGLGTFLPLFPIFKHDPNPFPQAHNDFLQIYWELGLIGGTIFLGYITHLLRKLFRKKEYLYISGLVCIGVNMFFAFPMRMIQTALMLIMYLAFCEKAARYV